MARPLKEGLTYFSHDVDMSSDQKILCLEAEHGLQGYAVYNKLLESIYSTSNGELDLSTEVSHIVLAKKFGISSKSFEKILKSCIIFKLFDENLYNSQKVLTSNGIKKRCNTVKFERERKRDWKNKQSKKTNPDSGIKNSSVVVDSVIDGDNTGTSNIIDNISDGNKRLLGVDNTTKESKVNKSKVNESKPYINTVSKDTDGQAHQVTTLEDLKTELSKATNKQGYLGKVFQTLHRTAPPDEIKNCYGRFGNLAKELNYDYDLILTAIFRTQDGMPSVIAGSHLNYIDASLRRNGSKEETKETPIPTTKYKLISKPTEKINDRENPPT